MEADPVVTFRNRLAEVKTDLDSAQQLNRDAAGKLSNLSTQTLAKLKEAVVVVEENVAVKVCVNYPPLTNQRDIPRNTLGIPANAE